MRDFSKIVGVPCCRKEKFDRFMSTFLPNQLFVSDQNWFKQGRESSVDDPRSDQPVKYLIRLKIAKE